MKILAILPSVKFYGKERSNVQVYKLLLSLPDTELNILINKDADEILIDYTKMFSPVKMLFPSRLKSRFRVLKYFHQMLVSNFVFIWHLFKINPDYIFINSEQTFYDFVLPLFVLRKNKIVFRIGDEPAFPYLSGYMINSLIWKYFVCKKVSRFICISNYIKKTTEQFGRYSDLDLVIYNVPPKRIQRECSSDEISKYHVIKNETSLKIGYIGQIKENKGVRILFDTAKELINEDKDIMFLFAGSLGSDMSLSTYLLKEKMGMKNSAKIVFLGEIDKVEMFFDQIDVLCVPSIYQEPLGNVLVEAKQYKKPIIIFPSGGMPELISHKENGYVCSGFTKSALKEGLLYYLENRNLIKKQGERSCDSIKELKIDYASFENKWRTVFV